MMSDSNSATVFTHRQKASDAALAPAPIPDGEETARRKEVDKQGDPLTHRVRAKTVVRDGEICVKVSRHPDSTHPVFGSGAVLPYHEWAQSGYVPERMMDHCDECGKVCSSEHQNPGGCVFCNHPELQD